MKAHLGPLPRLAILQISILNLSIGVLLDVTKVYAQPGHLDPEAVKVTETLDGYIFLGPDPTIGFDRFKQLENRQIQKLLQLDESVVQQLDEFRKETQKELLETMAAERAGKLPQGSMSILAEKHVIAAGDLLDEILTPEQQERLTQVIYRLEVMRVGIGEALTGGRLAIAAGIHNDQKDGIVRKATEIDSEVSNAYLELQSNAEEKLLKEELTPEQRASVRKLLGEPFPYRRWTHSQMLYQYKKREALAKKGDEQKDR